MIPIYKPYLPKQSIEYATDAIQSTWISSQGKYLEIFSEKLKELLNVKYVIPTNNGTTACHLMALCLERKIGKKKNIILCPDNVYIAAINSFLVNTNQFKLITVKSDLNTWNIDLSDLDKKIKKYPGCSVLIVHNVGGVVNVPELKKKYPETVFVEDCCEGFLGSYNNVYAGTEGYCAAISFFANKLITGGEAGALLTNNQEVFEYADVLRNQGNSPIRFLHNELGYNYRMSNIAAALLCGQLEVVHSILEMKENVFARYRTAFKNREDVFIQSDEIGTKHSNWMFGVKIPNHNNFERSAKFFRNQDIEIRPMFYGLSKQKFLLNNKQIKIGNCAAAEKLNKEIFILPSFPELTAAEQEHIIKTTNEYVKEQCKKP